MITQRFRHWPSAPTAVHGMYITRFAANAVTTEANWRSTKTWLSKKDRQSLLTSAHHTPNTHLPRINFYTNAMKAAPDTHY